MGFNSRFKGLILSLYYKEWSLFRYSEELIILSTFWYVQKIFIPPIAWYKVYLCLLITHKYEMQALGQSQF